MIIRTVTVTGADDSVSPADLVALSGEFPFVEWGILLSAKNMGKPRYPSRDWLASLQRGLFSGWKVAALSGHLCGRWVRDLCLGFNTALSALGDLALMFDRVQLNFHGEPHDFTITGLTEALRQWNRVAYIFQHDDVNNHVVEAVRGGVMGSVAPLFDLSGGTGVEPDAWAAWVPPYCGYAGGLHPDKLREQVDKIKLVVNRATARFIEPEIWIDVETHVRSDDDKKFDLDKVRKFLETARDLRREGA